MNRRPDPDPELARFLAAMSAASEDAAAADSDLGDAALRELLAALPRPLPRAGFAERTALAAVMGAMAAMPEPRAGFAGRRWRRAALAACLAATAFGVALLPFVLGVLRFALGRVTLSGATAGAAHLMTLVVGELGGSLADVSSFWQRLLPLQRALAAAVASPGMLAVVGLCLLISALALRFLHDLVERERSWTHAHPSR
jgi:hypothetical protein